MFFVRSEEQLPCPCCGNKLKVIGSRRRKYINSAGDIIILVIRRLRCLNCSKIHHELPDKLVPYKRYGRKSIEAVVGGDTDLTVPADESTIYRWKSWFLQYVNYFIGCLLSIAARYGRRTEEDLSCLPPSPLQRIWHLVGNSSGWLSRVVRPIANLNLWIHTRSAFLSL